MQSSAHTYHKYMCTTSVDVFWRQGCLPHGNAILAPLISQQAKDLPCNTRGQCSREGSQARAALEGKRDADHSTTLEPVIIHWPSLSTCRRAMCCCHVRLTLGKQFRKVAYHNMVQSFASATGWGVSTMAYLHCQCFLVTF